jgi:hypothetical protein
VVVKMSKSWEEERNSFLKMADMVQTANIIADY